MNNQEEESSTTKTVSENPTIEKSDENSTLNTNENSNINESPCSSENQKTSDLNISTEQSVRTRISMPQDIRYAAEPDDREKIVEKYNNYQVSDTNACNIRFLTDNKQKRNLLGRNEGT